MKHGGSAHNPPAPRSRWLAHAIAALLALALPIAAHAVSLKELVRLEGQGKSTLQGLGLVVGLPGTGDSAKQLVVARPLAKLLENSGNPIANFEELASTRSVALVMVTAEAPAHGVSAGDEIDAIVSAIGDSKSLAGGQLFLTPLRGPLPGQGVFAMADGSLVIEGNNLSRARVRRGAKIVQDIQMPTVTPDGLITLIIEHPYAGWSTSQLISNTINQHRVGLDDAGADIAHAVSDRIVRVRIPEIERPDPANFIADILSIRFDPSLIDLPARIVVNEREGVIVATGDVEISPTLITHGELVITTAPPPPPGVPPFPEASRWAAVHTQARPSETARLQDLLTAFRQLDVSVDNQIAILNMLRRSGNLHAELIID